MDSKTSKPPKRFVGLLFYLPALLIVAILLTGLVCFYFLGSQYVIDNNYAPRLLSLLSEKQKVIGAVMGADLRMFDDLSKDSVLRGRVSMLENPREQATRFKRRNADPTFEAVTAIALYLRERGVTDEVKQLELVSLEGRVLWGTQREAGRESHAVPDSFKRVQNGITRATVTGFQRCGDKQYCMAVIVPLFDSYGRPAAVLYALSGADRMIEALHLADGAYKSERTVIANKEGEVLLTASGIPVGGQKLPVSQTVMEGVVNRSSAFLYAIKPLVSGPMNLVGLVDRSEVLAPFNTVLVSAGTVCLAVFFVFVLQVAVLLPRYLLRPLARLVRAAQSMGKGNLDVAFGTGYKGGLFDLKRALETMLTDLKRKGSLGRARIDIKAGSGLGSSAMGASLSEMRAGLAAIALDADWLTGSAMSAENSNKAASISGSARSMLCLVDALSELGKLEAGQSLFAGEEFSLPDLIAEVADQAKIIAGARTVEFVLDCDERLAGKAASGDRLHLRQILMSLVNQLLADGEIGLITLLAAVEPREGQEGIEIVVAGTRTWLKRADTDNSIVETERPIDSVGLTLSRKLALLLGGKLTMERTPGKGTVFVLTVPSRGKFARRQAAL